jgi:hypothetical protein
MEFTEFTAITTIHHYLALSGIAIRRYPVLSGTIRCNPGRYPAQSGTIRHRYPASLSGVIQCYLAALRGGI